MIELQVNQGICHYLTTRGLTSRKASFSTSRLAIMIKTEKEYRECCRKIEKEQAVIDLQRTELQKMKLTEDEIKRALDALISFNQQLIDEVRRYEKVLRRDFGTINDLTSIGRVLIALRIANGISQKELANRLEVNVSQVSRDESNEYHGVSIDRAQRILDALGERLITAVQERQASVAVETQHHR
jgi:Cu/Ag efflux pump CusA